MLNTLVFLEMVNGQNYEQHDQTRTMSFYYLRHCAVSYRQVHNFQHVMTGRPLNYYSIADLPDKKVCLDCNKLKPISEYHIDKSRKRKDGSIRYRPYSECKQCWRKKRANDRKNRSEKQIKHFKSYHKKYWKTYKEKRVKVSPEYNKQYYQKMKAAKQFLYLFNVISKK